MSGGAGEENGKLATGSCIVNPQKVAGQAITTGFRSSSISSTCLRSSWVLE